MGTTRFTIGTVVAALLALAACATSPVDEQKRQDMEADIDEILSYELDKTEYGEPGNCLSESQYRSYRPLGDRHLVFEGRDDKQWVNVLRGRCPGLDNGGFLVMTKSLSGRLCDKDRFEVADQVGSVVSRGSAGTGPTCVLGEFRPLAKSQLKEAEARLEMR